MKNKQIVYKYWIGIFSAIFLFKRQRNPFLLAAYCYSWNCWPTFFINKKRWHKKRWENKKKR